MKGLETSLDTQLFDRVGKQMLLTHDGKTLVNALSRYQEGLSDALGQLKSGQAMVKGIIRLGIFYGFSNALAAEFLASLQHEHPELEVDVIFGSPSELDRLLQYKRVDFTINLFKTKGEGTIRDLKLGADELWLLSSQPPPRRSLGFQELRNIRFCDRRRYDPNPDAL